ncbi:MAG: HDOD domain-containing protein [Phycisphaerales bacterium]
MARRSRGALAAEELASLKYRSVAGTAFLCALLRDIGKLALNVGIGERYTQLVAQHTGDVRSFVEAERAAMGFDHAQLGAAMARKWGLPPEVADAIEHHHAPPAGHVSPLTDLVHAADAVCRWMGPGVGTDGMEYTFDAGVQNRLGIDRQRVEAVVLAVFCRLKDIERPKDTSNGVAA